MINYNNKRFDPEVLKVLKASQLQMNALLSMGPMIRRELEKGFKEAQAMMNQQNAQLEPLFVALAVERRV